MVLSLPSQSGRIRPASNVAFHAVPVPNLMQMSDNSRFSSVALNSVQVKCDVRTALKVCGA